MQTLTLNMPQTLRVRLQEYQNKQGIALPEEAVISALQAYFEAQTAASTLPAMYDAEDGPCEVITSFLEPKSERKSC